MVAEHCYTRNNTQSKDQKGKWQQHPQQQGQPAHGPQAYTGTNWPHHSSMVTTVSTRTGSTRLCWHYSIQTTQDFSRAVQQQQQYSQMQNYKHQRQMMMKQDDGLQRPETYTTYSSTYAAAQQLQLLDNKESLETATASRPSGSYTKGFNYLLAQGA